MLANLMYVCLFGRISEITRFIQQHAPQKLNIYIWYLRYSVGLKHVIFWCVVCDFCLSTLHPCRDLLPSVCTDTAWDGVNFLPSFPVWCNGLDLWPKQHNSRSSNQCYRYCWAGTAQWQGLLWLSVPWLSEWIGGGQKADMRQEEAVEPN